MSRIRITIYCPHCHDHADVFYSVPNKSVAYHFTYECNKCGKHLFEHESVALSIAIREVP
jgi:uncharacterized Zn finger protein